MMILALLSGSAFSVGSSASYKLAAEVLDSGAIKGSSASFQLLGKSRGHGLSARASSSYIIGEGFLRSAYSARAVFAPIVTAVEPATAAANQKISLTISGANFTAGAAVKLTLSGETDITASNVVIAGSGQITGDFDLQNAKAGSWAVTVTNPDGRAGTLPAAFVVTAVAPTVSSITPAKGLNDALVSITDLAGQNFRSGAAVKLSLTGASDISADKVVVESAAKITCRFNLVSKTVGIYDVVVTNDDGLSGTLAAIFKIESPVLEVIKPVESEKNPFDPRLGPTTLSYSLSQDVNLTVYIFNIRGERIWEYRAPAGTPGGQVGENKVLWDGITLFRENAPAGVYLVHLTTTAGGGMKTLSKTKIAIIR
ncbi:MAG: hypothetical protein WC632_08285 [Candidatus Margulisiibacteriota bacterium]